MNEFKRIGEALLESGLITEAQLAKAVDAQGMEPDKPLGIMISEMFDVPVEDVDQANLQHVLLPRFRKQVLGRLLQLSRGDKFARGLDMTAFVSQITTRALSFEVAGYLKRLYADEGGSYVRQPDARGFTTSMEVQVSVMTVNGQEVSGKLHAQHESQSDRLVITDDEVLIKENIYYGVRTAFRSPS